MERKVSRRVRILAGTVAVLLAGGLSAGYATRNGDPTAAPNAAAPVAATTAASAPSHRADGPVSPRQSGANRAKAPAVRGKPGAAKPGRGQAIKDAQAAVRRNNRALRAAEGDRYQPRDVLLDDRGTRHVRFDRTYRGLKVLGGDFVVHSAPDGSFAGATVAQRAPVSVETRPVVTKRQAVAVAEARFEGRRRQSSATLVVDAVAGTPALAWQVLVVGTPAAGTASRLVVVVDARTGAVRRAYAGVQTAEPGTGHGLHVGDVRISTTKGADGSFTLSDPDHGGGEVRDALDMKDFVSTLDPSRPFLDADNAWGNGALTDRATLAVDVHYGVGKAWDYFAATHDRRGPRDDGKAPTAYVHGGEPDNASWSDSCFCMIFGDGRPPGRPFTSLDVTGHEFAHGVTAATAGLAYFAESGGLNEATSDIFGTLVEFAAGNPADPPDYLVAEKTDGGGPGHALRYMDEPNRDGKSVSCWSPTIKDLDVHRSSGVGNKFFYQLAVGSGESQWGTSTPCAGAPPVTGIGNEKAGAIWYRALTAYMVSSTNYSAARLATLQAAADLYGDGGAEHRSVAAAWAAVGVDGSDAVPVAPVIVYPGRQTSQLGAAVSVPLKIQDPQRQRVRVSASGLPEGLWISDSGLVSGTPRRRGEFTVTVTAVDPDGNAGSREFTWVIKGPPTFKTVAPQFTKAGDSVYLFVDAQDDPFDRETFTVTGLPDGLTLEGSATFATIKGVPTKPGTWTVVVTATDNDGNTGTTSFPWTVRQLDGPYWVVVTGGAGTARVGWSYLGSGPGYQITGYTVTVVPGRSITVGPTSTSANLTGLAANRAYTIRVHANTTVGASVPTSITLHPSQLTLTAPAAVPYRKPTVLRGGVTQQGKGVAGLTVTVQERRAGQTAWTRVATAKTGRTGAWSATVRPTANSSVRASIAGREGLLANSSPIRAVAVAYVLTAKASRTTANPRQQVKISGSAQPARAKTKVTLQRLVGKRWVTVATGKTATNGSYAFSRAFARGTWTLRVHVAGGPANAAGVSGTVKLRVR